MAIALLIFLSILGLLVIVHELGHFIIAKRLGVRVDRFSLGFGPQILKKKKGDTEYDISLMPLGGYVELAGDSLESYKGKPDEYLFQSPGRRFQIIFFGPLLNYFLGFLCFWIIFFSGYPTLTTKVGGVLDGFGAKDAGITVGDRIITIDGKSVSYWEDLQKVVHLKKQPAQACLGVLRGDREYTVNVRIKEKELGDLIGQKYNVGLLGITPSDEIVEIRHGLAEAFFLSAYKTWSITKMTYIALGRMITGRLSIRDSVTGPLGMFYITSKVARLGIIAVLQLIAVLSINLAIFNLLPLPVLDGGHIFLLILEKIRGKPLGLTAERILTKVGITIIISLAIIVTFNDLLRFGDRIVRFLSR